MREIRSYLGKETTMTAIASRNSTLHREQSDTELERRLTNFLYQRRVPGAEHIQLVAQGGVVAISGRTPTRSAKWLCIECCRRVAGVIRVIDNVEVEAAVTKHPARVPIRKEIKNCGEFRFDDSAADGYRPCIPFQARHIWKRRSLAASSGRKLKAAA